VVGLSTVLAVLTIHALGAMGSPCARPSKDIRARIESALDGIDEISHDALPLKVLLRCASSKSY
jgi:hypothetical protein